MSTKHTKGEDVLGLTSIDLPHPLQTGIVPFGQPNRALTREEKRISEECEREMLIIEGQREKTKFGTTAIGDIRDHSSFVFQDTVVAIAERQREMRGHEFEAYLVEFNRLNVQGCARNLLGAAEVGATNIGAMIFLSLDLPPEQLSLWKRLFG